MSDNPFKTMYKKFKDDVKEADKIADPIKKLERYNALWSEIHQKTKSVDISSRWDGEYGAYKQPREEAQLGTFFGGLWSGAPSLIIFGLLFAPLLTLVPAIVAAGAITGYRSGYYLEAKKHGLKGRDLKFLTKTKFRQKKLAEKIQNVSNEIKVRRNLGELPPEPIVQEAAPVAAPVVLPVVALQPVVPTVAPPADVKPQKELVDGAAQAFQQAAKEDRASSAAAAVQREVLKDRIPRMRVRMGNPQPA